MKKTIVLAVLFVSACATHDKRDNVYRSSADGRPLVDDKYLLRPDRPDADTAPAEVSPEKKQENEEMAAIWRAMSELKKPPTEIREKFDTLLRKTRSQFDRDMTKEREAFTKGERRRREDFLKAQQTQRNQFTREKHTKEEKDDFYKSMDEKRSEYFSAEREKRDDFESDVRERRRSFDDSIRQKQSEFTQEHRAYMKAWEDMKKNQSSAASRTGPGFSQTPSFADSTATSATLEPTNRPRSARDEAQELERELQDSRSMPSHSLESGQ